MRVYLSSADVLTPQCLEIMKDVKGRAIPDHKIDFLPVKPDEAVPDKATVFAMGTYKRKGNERVVPAPSVAQVVTKPDIITRLSTAFRLLATPPELPEFEYEVIDDMEVALGLLASANDKKVVVDIETSGNIDIDVPEPSRLISIAICAGGPAYVFPEEMCQDRVFYEEFCRFLERNRIITTNGKFDLKYFPDAKANHYRDTQLAHYALFPAAGEHGLKECAKMYFGFEDWDEPAKAYTKNAVYETYEKFEDGSWHDARKYWSKKGKSGFERIPRKMLYRYNGFDVYANWHWDQLMEEFLADDPDSQMVLDWLMQYSEMFMPVEKRGIRLDLPYLEELSRELNQELVYEKTRLNQIAETELNPNSHVQIHKWYAAHGVELPKRRNSKGRMAPSTSEDAIKEFIESEPEDTPEVEFARQLLVCRGLVKTVGTYVDGYRLQADENGIVRPGYKLTASITGRLGGQGASMLTIPREKRLKKMVLPYQPGHVVIGADASQMELRIMAIESMDEWLIEAFQPGAIDFFDNLLTNAYPKQDWVDMHCRVEEHLATEAEANFYNNKRSSMKSTVYGASFNRQAPAIAKELKISMHEAYTLMEAFIRPGSAFALWREDITERALNGESIVTRFGRHFQSELVTKANKQSVINSAMAFTSQSTGNDLLLSAALEINKNLPAYGAHLMGTIHDAAYASGPKHEAELIGEMLSREIVKSGQRVYGDIVPFVSKWGFGANLAEA